MISMKEIIYCIAIVYVFTVLACTSSKDTSGEIDSVTDSYMIVSHQVKNLEGWKSVYALTDSLRSGSGVTADQVLFDVEDSSRIVVTAFTQGHESARQYLGDETLASYYAAAEIETEQATLWDVQWTNSKSELPEFVGYLHICHGVQEFDTWHEVYKESDSLRVANGIHTLVIGTGLDSANYVGVLFGISQFDGVDGMLKNMDLKKAMLRAGVLGDPDVMVLAGIE